jgi:hypothetical protein
MHQEKKGGISTNKQVRMLPRSCQTKGKTCSTSELTGLCESKMGLALRVTVTSSLIGVQQYLRGHPWAVAGVEQPL